MQYNPLRINPDWILFDWAQLPTRKNSFGISGPFNLRLNQEGKFGSNFLKVAGMAKPGQASAQTLFLLGKEKVFVFPKRKINSKSGS